jgi:hypothetical protein
MMEIHGHTASDCVDVTIEGVRMLCQTNLPTATAR